MEKISSLAQTKTASLNPVYYEAKTWQKSALLSGIDEVGRGCLAGPVVACAAVLHPNFTHPLLKDSKILTENQRVKMAAILQGKAWYGFGIIDHTEIDMLNIYQATLKAMQRAYVQLITQPGLPQLPGLVVIDAMPLKLGYNNPEVVSFTQGESKSISIAAASILAKVKRDTLMKRLEKQFPGYNLERNKGYAAPVHRTHLTTAGPSLIHRNSFITNLIKGKTDEAEQTSLFC